MLDQSPAVPNGAGLHDSSQRIRHQGDSVTL